MLILAFIAVSLLKVCVCIPLEEFYPYGTAIGDSKLVKNDDGSSPRVTISSLFPFFNNQHNSLFVNTNGAISFLRTLNTFTPLPFPLSDGRRIVAPFWADVDIRNGGDVFYRETTNSTILQRATDDVRVYVPSQIRFSAAWVFIATWDNVAFYGANSIGKTKRNTFQAVLITNGRHSFAMLNYFKIQWTTGTASNGGASTGTGGTPAQVGFNAGDGVNFFALNTSRTAGIIDVASQSNVATPGRFMFRIDTEKIENGGCNTGGSLTITPRHGTMLGGQSLMISGPCLTETDNITVTYEVVKNIFYPCERKSQYSMTCITPAFYTTGDTGVVITVTHEDGTVSNYTGIYNILNIANTNPLLIRSNPKRWKFGQTVELTWDQQQIPFNDQFVKLDIFYIILKEQSFELDWLHGGTVFPNISVDQERASFQFLPRIYVALFRLSPADGTDVWHAKAAWSDVFPVVPPSNTVSRTLCSVWYANDMKLQAVSNDDSPPCPCTLRQALLDTGRFHRDPLCNSFTTGDTSSLNCIHHGSADHCVRMNVLGSRGTGRLCCYDKTGNLMDARNLDGGGTVHRHHYFGSDGNIPFLSNFYFDIVPYLQCCLYQNETSNSGGGRPGRPLSLTAIDMTTNIVGNTCPKFFERRPASDCKGYVPPRPARGNGDPHIKTLDGLAYTFNGAGEYVFMRDVDRKFTAQARMEAVTINGVKKSASVFTSIVARTENVSDTVEVRLNSIRVADVYLNGEPVDFHDARWLDIKGGSLLLLQAQENNTKEFLVMFTKPLVSFTVKATANLINIITCLSDTGLKGKVEGLLGDYDGNPDNDLQSDNRAFIAAMSPLRQIHYQFGEKWRITAEDSMFTYPIGKSYNDYADPSFTPNFVAPVMSDDNAVCGGNFDCMYDLQTTGSEDIAMLTKEISEEFEVLEQAAQPVTSCGLPPDITNGQWNSTGYIAGSRAFLNCNNGYNPGISAVIVCGNDGSWDSKNVQCIPKSGQDRIRLTLPVTFLVAVILEFVIGDHL